jgi:hypothetical protein
VQQTMHINQDKFAGNKNDGCEDLPVKQTNDNPSYSCLKEEEYENILHNSIYYQENEEASIDEQENKEVSSELKNTICQVK